MDTDGNQRTERISKNAEGQWAIGEAKYYRATTDLTNPEYNTDNRVTENQKEIFSAIRDGKVVSILVSLKMLKKLVFHWNGFSNQLEYSSEITRWNCWPKRLILIDREGGNVNEPERSRIDLY